MTMTDEKSSDNRSFPENASPDPVTHGNVQVTATETIELSSDKPVNDFTPLASGLNSHQKQLQTNNNYNSMNTSFDNMQAKMNSTLSIRRVSCKASDTCCVMREQPKA